MTKKTLIGHLLVWFALACVAFASDPRGEINSAYQRSSRAMGLKYRAGVYSIRAPGFKLFNPDGDPVDLDLESAALANLFAPALEIRETPKILKFQMLGPDKAVCEVSVEAICHMVKRRQEGTYDLRMRTVCRDTWTRVQQKWMLSESRVLAQELKRL